MTDRGPKFVDEEYDAARDDQTTPDLEFMIQIGTEICFKVHRIWGKIGAIWLDAQNELRGRDPEVSNGDESDSGFEEDPRYKPVYRIRDILKWGAVWMENDDLIPASVADPILAKIYERLNDTESPRGSPEPSQQEPFSMITEETSTIYSLCLQDLPSELLTEIVQLAVRGDQHIVITMSHVNTKFRAFMLSTPIFWTTIDIMLPEKRIRAYLERSGSSLLRVRASLVLLTTGTPQGLVKLESFKRMIQPHVARIAALEMRYTNSLWSATALAQLPGLGTLANLDEFDFGILLHQPVPANDEFQFSCKPKKIRIEGLGIKTFRPIYSERVVSLEATECWERGLTDWRDALQSMPSLQVLKLSDFQIEANDTGESVNFETTISSISLPHLQTLSFTRLPRPVLRSLIKALQTPNLISVTIASLATDDLQGFNGLAPWMKPRPTDMSEVVLLPFASANPQLQELDLHNCWMTPDMWTAVFAQLHNLKKLRIASCDVTSEDLRSLVASPGTPPTLPSLTHLILDNESLDKNADISFSLIDAIITTRWTSFNQQVDGGTSRTQSQALKSVVLRGWNESYIPPTYETTDFDRLSGLVERLHVETLQATSEDSDATDGEWESQSEGSWASGDQAVVELGDSVHKFEWGMELEEESDDLHWDPPGLFD